MSKKFWSALSLVVLLGACSDPGDLKTVHTQQAGEYTITVLSETGSIKNGTSEFVLEFQIGRAHL